ncbi:DUF7146 domain-containing protein [Prosthecomicrobium sp. N25]|uniref:DUF7146 domain-containing protein n=1 Tax=Prosthecomicrobium sp. N25 TaxID=3129254 RepID=UPI003077D8B9
MRTEKYRTTGPSATVLDPRAVADRLGGEVQGRRVLAPGPGHHPADRSLSILIDPNAPGGFVVHSFAGDDPLVCRDHVKAMLGVANPKLGSAPVDLGANFIPRSDPSDEERTATALRIWGEAGSIVGTRVETYLARRGVRLPPGAAGEAIRYHRRGYMVALVRDIETDAPKAIHRTFLTPDGRKADRKALGPIGGGAIKLTPDADVTYSLGLGEGIETVLSLRNTPEFGPGPVWATISANGLRSFPVLPAIESLWLAVDDDPAGHAAAAESARRWSDAGRETFTIRQPGGDLNDRDQEVAYAR